MKTEKNILIAFILNLSFSIFELIGGLFTGSIAITSDSIHDLCDAFSILISFFLEKKSKKKADLKYTYGYVRYSVIGGIITSTILLIGSILVIYEAIKRLINPVKINYNGMIIFAIIGVIINLIAAIATKEGDSLNQRSVNLHMLEDVLGWIIVLIGSICMYFTNITYIDSILSIIVSIFILVSAFKNIKIIYDLFLEKTPKNINIEEVKKQLLSINGVSDVHHIHVRSIDGFNTYMTLHVVLDNYDSKIKQQIKEDLNHYGISHSTIEIELKNELCTDINCEIKHVDIHHH